MIYPEAKLFTVSDTAYSVEFGDEISEELSSKVASLVALLDEERPLGLIELIPSYRCVMVEYDPLLVDAGQMLELLADCARRAQGRVATVGRTVEIPVCYGGQYGPDLADVAVETGLSEQDLIAMHSAGDYLVHMMGFTPGFAYLGGMDKRLACSRLSTPRTSVLPGSVGIAGEQTGVYPLATPGGWRLIGCTPLKLFDASSASPFLLSGGDRVRFVSIDETAFLEMEASAEANEKEVLVNSHVAPDLIWGPEEDLLGTCVCPTIRQQVDSHVAPDLIWGPEEDLLDACVCPTIRQQVDSHVAPDLIWGPEEDLLDACVCPTIRQQVDCKKAPQYLQKTNNGVRIVQKGMLTTIQDTGRRGYQRFGVPVSGVMDWFASSLANILVGNSAGAPLLEVTVMGPVIDIQEDCCFAVTGAVFALRLNGEPVPMNSCVAAPAGSRLDLGMALAGARGYIAFSGGLEVKPDMGSASTYLKAGLGGLNGKPLQNGDWIGVQPAGLPADLRAGFDKCNTGADFLPPYSASPQVRVVIDARPDYFAANAAKVLTTGTYTVARDSDRMGYRLEGPSIPYTEGSDGNIISEGVAFGSIQIAGGKPIILMADRQTTGGYAKLGTVITADLPLVAQLRPGDTLSFAEVSLSEAQDAHAAMRRQLADLKAALSHFEFCSKGIL
ncbi:MAG: 5-oxoprolinase subunit PxpB [Coriobacteriia bacterium]|nr:5-oxoprolinase subunit PxpB [Coriobacteriia bacterium]